MSQWGGFKTIFPVTIKGLCGQFEQRKGGSNCSTTVLHSISGVFSFRCMDILGYFPPICLFH